MGPPEQGHHRTHTTIVTAPNRKANAQKFTHLSSSMYLRNRVIKNFPPSRIVSGNNNKPLLRVLPAVSFHAHARHCEREMLTPPERGFYKSDRRMNVSRMGSYVSSVLQATSKAWGAGEAFTEVLDVLRELVLGESCSGQCTAACVVL
jgi:hypothetical protein